MDHRPERRRPRRTHRIAPAPPAGPPLAPDYLAAAARTPPLVVRQPTPRIASRSAIERSNAASSAGVCTCRYRARRRPTAPPAARTRCADCQTPDRRDTTRHDRTARRRPCDGAAVGRMRPKGAPAATRLRPRPPEAGSQIASFRCASPSHLCAGLLPAQRDFSRSFAPCLPSGGGGNRTRVRDRTERTSTSVVRAWISSGGRRRTPYRRTSSSCGSRASGDQLSFGSEPDVGAPSLASGRARGDVARPRFD